MTVISSRDWTPFRAHNGRGLSSSGTVVSVPVSGSSSSRCSEPMAGGSVLRPARSHSSLADVFGKTAHMLVSWLLFVLEEGRLDFVFPSGLWLTFADRCGMLDCVVDRPLSKPGADRRFHELEGLGFLVCSVVRFSDQKLPVMCLLGCCCIGGCHTHVQSRAASRDSSGCGCETVVVPGSASFSPPKTA